MSSHLLTVKAFLDKVKSLSFWGRLFEWGSIKRDLVDAAASLATAQTELASSEHNLASANLHLSVAKETTRNLENQMQLLMSEISTLKERLQNCQRDLQSAREEVIQFKKEDEFRQQKYSEEIASLQSLKNQIQEERAKEVQQRHEEEMARLLSLKETWAAHQSEVQGKIKSICQKHTLQYVDKAPFRGEPDNTLLICEEHVVFDAKSPAGDDLKNFPQYLKAQAEAARKYAKIEGVKKDIFLVIPANTLPVVNQFVYNMADYDVYVVSADVLEPLILSLCRIEDYEFAKQLSPEERENICRIIGKFAHLSKRRIQIDSFFARQFIELAYRCENSLPTDIHEKVLEFEKSEKLNPPMEKRAKAINTKDLDVEQIKIETEVSAKGIVLPNAVISGVLNELTLYK
jgi:myosin heavy subunit